MQERIRESPDLRLILEVSIHLISCDKHSLFQLVFSDAFSTDVSFLFFL